MQAYLTITRHGQEQRIDCKDVMVIGRVAGNDIVLDDQRVSRRHAMLYRTQDGSFYVVDEGSSNGTLVNGVRINLPTRLADGDCVTIGSLDLHFHQPTTVPSTAPRTDTRPTTIIMHESVEIHRFAILVADMRGFTRLSEAIPVKELTEIMNQWFRESTQCIKQRRGTVDKFLGDCVYARWEANVKPAEVLIQTLDAACELNRATNRLNESYPHLPQRLSLGVGINIGSAALGTEQGRTAIGDAVNLTFRLQEQTKVLGLPILLNSDAYMNLPNDPWQGHEQTVSVAGKTRPLSVWGISFEEAAALVSK